MVIRQMDLITGLRSRSKKLKFSLVLLCYLSALIHEALKIQSDKLLLLCIISLHRLFRGIRVKHQNLNSVLEYMRKNLRDSDFFRQVANLPWMEI